MKIVEGRMYYSFSGTCYVSEMFIHNVKIRRTPRTTASMRRIFTYGGIDVCILTSNLLQALYGDL